jgi:hypothetical protein
MLPAAQPTLFLIAVISVYMVGIAAAYGAALSPSVPSFVAQPEAELAARDVDRGAEPELAAPRADGPLSGLQPLTIVG